MGKIRESLRLDEVVTEIYNYLKNNFCNDAAKKLIDGDARNALDYLHEQLHKLKNRANKLEFNQEIAKISSWISYFEKTRNLNSKKYQRRNENERY